MLFETTTPEMASTLSCVIDDLGLVIFQAGEDGRLSPVGALPDWFPVSDQVEQLPFLDFFLSEAHVYWNSPDHKMPLRSGYWEEQVPDGEPIVLEATALPPRDGARRLVVRRVGEDYQEHRELVQRSNEYSMHSKRLDREIQKKQILLQCIVHDLKSPLATVLMNLQMLESKIDSEKTLRFVELAKREAERQAGMIQSIMDVFSAELADLAVLNENVYPDLKEEADRIVEALFYKALERNLGLALEVEDTKSGWCVVAERGHLNRVLENLLVNALRHSPAERTVVLRIQSEDDWFRVSVEDEGAGVDPRLAEKIFDPFVQSQEGGGQVGLGLHFCKLTIEQWGGQIGYEPRPGGGARFWFTLRRG